MKPSSKKYILLSFDTEEFDVPREQGVEISLERSMEVSVEGTTHILNILKENGVTATFFCTTTFAQNAPDVMKRIIEEGHEVASHGVDHWQPKESDVTVSKQILEDLCHCMVQGYRQPRMFPVENSVLEQAGYRYNSSLHPTFIPGRYMHLNVSRTPFREGRLLQIPASVTPWLRLPVFWLACHHYPQWLYKRLCRRTLRHDGQFVIYFHPWEFYDLKAHREWKIPYTIRHNSGEEMAKRLQRLIQTFKAENALFITYNKFTSMQ
jgi:peptidoglycan/xylan/chitin deacetylase (PgdA/CDA1 family)